MVRYQTFALKVTHKVYNQPDNVLAKTIYAIQLPLHVTNTGVEKTTLTPKKNEKIK
jgi:hypothetical protein